MEDKMLLKTAEKLTNEVSTASPRKRLELQPELNRVVEHMIAQGMHVPPRVRDLNTVLLEEAIEDRFDNMPV